jgi:hypothetical protein
MKMRKFLEVAVCLASVVGATLLFGAAQNEADASKAALELQLKETLKARAESAQTAYEAMTAAFETETVTFDTFADAIKELAEAEVALATKPEEEIAALRRNVERTKRWETRIKDLFDAGVRGYEAKEYCSAKRDRESAEILLLKAQIKAKQ